MTTVAGQGAAPTACREEHAVLLTVGPTHVTTECPFSPTSPYRLESTTFPTQLAASRKYTWEHARHHHPHF